MRKIEYVVSDERLITPSGLSLVGQVLGKSNLIKKANRMRTAKRSQPQIKNGDILMTMIGLLSLGKSDFERRGEKTYIPEDSPLLSEHDIVPSDMRHLRTDVRGQYCENGIRYDYNAAGALICIRWENEDIRLTLSNNGRLDQYPVGYDTPVSKLLFGNSHIDAIKNVPVIYRLCE